MSVDTEMTRDELIAKVIEQADRIAWLEGEVAGLEIKLTACEEKNKELHDQLKGWLEFVIEFVGDPESSAYISAKEHLAALDAE